MNRFGAVVFDMDGVIIDSEPFWLATWLAIGADYNMPMTESDYVAFIMGRRTDDQVDQWCAQHPDKSVDRAAMADAVVQGVMARIRASGKALPGLYESLDAVQAQKLRLGLASSSSYALITAALERLQLTQFDVVRSAADEQLGKPAPDVYLSAARALGVEPQHCIAIEDSRNGIAAAKAAGMFCVAVPEPGSDPAKSARADVTLSTLVEFPALLGDIATDRS